MTDALGFEIKPGDQVLYADATDSRVDFELATVVRLTPKMIEISYMATKWGMNRPKKHLTSSSRIVLYPPPGSK